MIARLVAAIAVLTACAGHVPPNGVDATVHQADALGVAIENSRTVGSSETTTAELIARAATEEHAEVIRAEDTPARTDGSIYHWTRLVVRLHATAQGAGGTEHSSSACWVYVYEGRFLREGPSPTVC